MRILPPSDLESLRRDLTVRRLGVGQIEAVMEWAGSHHGEGADRSAVEAHFAGLGFTPEDTNAALASLVKESARPGIRRMIGIGALAMLVCLWWLLR